MENKEAIIELVARNRSNPLMSIVPDGVQEQWWRTIGTHRDGIDPRTKILSAANKFIGKTAGTCAAVSNIIWGPQNDWFDYPIYRNWSFPKNGWIISTSSAIRDVIVPEMKKWFPKGRYTFRQGHKDYPYEWHTDTGFNLYLKTFEEDPEEFESVLLGFAWISEVAPKQIYDAVPRRMSEGGIIMWEMTPLEGSGWAFEDLVDTGKATITYGDIWEGCMELHPNRGRHPKKKIETWISTIRNLDHIDPCVHGKPGFYLGAIFKTFNENAHVVPAKELHVTEQIWMGIDPHWAKPPFIQWWALNNIGELRCVLEFPRYQIDEGYETIRDTKLTIENLCEIILETEKMFGFEGKVVRRVMDPYFGAHKYGDQEYSVQQKYAMHGVRCVFPPENKIVRIEIGHSLIRDWLHYDPAKPMQAKPRVTWEEHCRNSIRSMKRYSVVEPRKPSEHKDALSETYPVTEQWKHGIDPFRYIVLCNPTYQHPVGHEKPKGWREQVLKPRATNWNPMAA